MDALIRLRSRACRRIDDTERSAGRRQFLQGQDHHAADGNGPGRQLRSLWPHHCRPLWPAHSGQSDIIVEHLPGAGGVVAGNYIYGAGPQDGSKILLSHALPLVEKLEPKGVQFESAKFRWLGTYDFIAQCLRSGTPFRCEASTTSKRKSLVVGSFNKTHLTYQWAMLTNNALGTSYKVITGYPSGNELNLAMERGEISGWVAAWANIAGTRPEWVRDKKVTMLVAYTLERMADLPDVPTLLELAPPDKKDVVEFITAGTPFARGLAVGPARARGPRRRAAQGVRRADEGQGVSCRRRRSASSTSTRATARRRTPWWTRSPPPRPIWWRGSRRRSARKNEAGESSAHGCHGI